MQQPALHVALADFPLFDGITPLEPFIHQCERLMVLGGITSSNLSSILAARCRGLAQQVVEGATPDADIAALLRSSFLSSTTATAAAQLSTAEKGTQSALEYSLQIKRLVHEACPEFFDAGGQVKKICAPSYQAALYRHFLVGLSQEDKTLLSRQGVQTFDAAVSELIREESLPCPTEGRHSVRWADCATVSAADHSHSSAGPEFDATWRRRSVSPGRHSRDRRQQYREPSPRWSPGNTDRWQHQRGSRGFSPRMGRRSSLRGAGGGSSSDREFSPPRPSSGDRWQRRSEWRDFSPRTGRGSSPGAGRESASAGPDRDQEAPWDSPGDGRRQQRRRPPQCYGCRGFGHLKRECPNGRLGGRRW